MHDVVSILFAACFTVSVCFSLGVLVLRALRVPLHRGEERLLGFVTGAACLSLLVFALASVRLARQSAFFALGCIILAVAFVAGVHRPQGDPLPALDRWWKALFGLLIALFGAWYFVCALAPESSPDGATYHLGLVSRYFRAHGFYRITTDMYASLSQGAELLFLFAFAFGRHSSAALVHFSFLAALPGLMLFYGRRFGFPAAGAAAGLFMFLSPIAGFDGSTAYIDVALACVIFALFYLLQIWHDEPAPGLLVAIGLLAGFAYAVKYTGFLAVPYALGFVAWKLRRKRAPLLRPLAIVAGCALLMILPWLVKNWIVVGNPFSPFLNRLFPNPYVHIQVEEEYRAFLANWGEFRTKWLIPLEVTVRGDALQGVIGPLFLLFPLALLALRYPHGRRALLAAAVFLLAYPANIGTRLLLPALPFVSLALALAVMNWRFALPVLVLFHALASWPGVLKTYCTSPLRIYTLPVAAALRRVPESKYLEQSIFNYPVARMVDELVPPGSVVIAYNGPPQAYTEREVLTGYVAALNNNMADLLSTPVFDIWLPVRRLTFNFAPRAVRALRIVQTVPESRETWGINEMRIYSGGRELPREHQWRLRASPNPWEVQFAFDNNPATRWRSWQRLYAGMYVEVDFGRAITLDRVVLEAAPDQDAARPILEARSAGAAEFQKIAADPERADAPPPLNLRRMATAEIKRNGIDYVLINDTDPFAKEFVTAPGLWGLKLIGERRGAHLYRIE